MRVAIIGGGASGVVTAYLLAGTHDVHLFEKSRMLGGNIRTLNRNVKGASLPQGVHVENGVLGFHQGSYPTFHRLMSDLGVELTSFAMHNGMFLENGRSLLTPPPRAATGEKRLASATTRSSSTGRNGPIRTILKQPTSVGERMIRASLMLAYSTPWERTLDFPLALADEHLSRVMRPLWSAIPGGVYSYVERILERVGEGIHIHLGADIAGVRRDHSGVELRFTGGESQRLDKVVFATPPAEALKLLEDMSDSEARRFSGWTTHAFTTTAHSDVSFYESYGSPALSPCDFFLKSDGSFGYNTNMNRGYGLDVSTPYSFAHGMDDVIRPESVLDRFTHQVPAYTVEAIRHCDEIRMTNGENHTYYAGAYLGGGLHEGTVVSALAVSQALGGRSLPPSPSAGGL